MHLTYSGGSSLLLRSQSEDASQINTFAVNLLDVDCEQLETSEQAFSLEARIPSRDLWELCRNFADWGDIVTIEGSDRGLSFTSSGAAGRASVVFKHEDDV